MFNPKISVIATFYNSDSLGDYVNKSMNMLLNQTYRNLEIICVNDGSTDTTYKTLQKFATLDERIVLINKNNQKYAQYAKAAGQHAATGEWCLLFDHDDEITLDAVQEAVAVAASAPEAQVVSLNVEQCSASGELLAFYNLDLESSYRQFIPRELSGREYLQKTVGRFDVHIRALVKTELFKSFSFKFSEPLLNADEIVERQIFGTAKKIVNSKGIYRYFQHHNSSAKTASVKRIDIVKTDILLRELFIAQGVYTPHKELFEKTAFRSLTEGVKIFHQFYSELSAEERKSKRHLLAQAFTKLQKDDIIRNQTLPVAFYRTFLLSSFLVMFYFYKFK